VREAGAGHEGAVSAWSLSAPPKGGDRHDPDARKRRRPAGLIADYHRRRALRGLFAHLHGGRLGKECSSAPHADCVPLPFEEVDCLRHRLDGLLPLASAAQYLCPVEEHFRPRVEGVRLLRLLLSIEAEPRRLFPCGPKPWHGATARGAG